MAVLGSRNPRPEGSSQGSCQIAFKGAARPVGSRRVDLAGQAVDQPDDRHHGPLERPTVRLVQAGHGVVVGGPHQGLVILETPVGAGDMVREIAGQVLDSLEPEPVGRFSGDRGEDDEQRAGRDAA